MTSHLIEIGPHSARRLCCGTATVADAAAQRAAYESIDDQFALLDSEPVAVASLWQSLLASLDCGTSARVTVVYPSWWSSARVGVVDDAVYAMTSAAEIRPRTWLLRQVFSSPNACVLEVADDFVVITDGVGVAVRASDADSISALLLSTGPDTVVIDAPSTVPGGRALAMAISARLADSPEITVETTTELRLRSHVGQVIPSTHTASVLRSPAASRLRTVSMVAVLAGVGALLGVAAWPHRTERHRTERHPDHLTEVVVEGRITLEVPAGWSTTRVVGGPGSARLQVTSPTDPHVAVHATQSRVAVTGLDATADFLKSAIDAAPPGVFVDFDPAAHPAGRPAVTYREVRADRDILWNVWVDRAVRISIGCQSRSGQPEPVRPACELAVRSAHEVS